MHKHCKSLLLEAPAMSVGKEQGGSICFWSFTGEYIVILMDQRECCERYLEDRQQELVNLSLAPAKAV